MSKRMRTGGPPPDCPGRPADWQEQIKADLAAQLEAGGTLYSFRPDGTCVAETKYGERIIELPDRESA